MTKYYFKAAAETTNVIKLRIKIIIFSAKIIVPITRIKRQ